MKKRIKSYEGKWVEWMSRQGQRKFIKENEWTKVKINRKKDKRIWVDTSRSCEEEEGEEVIAFNKKRAGV